MIEVSSNGPYAGEGLKIRGVYWKSDSKDQLFPIPGILNPEQRQPNRGNLR